MNIGIEVNVFYLKTENELLQQELGIEVKFSNCTLKPYRLYQIDYVTRFDNDNCKCVVSSGGLDLVINESYESLNERIEKLQTFRLN